MVNSKYHKYILLSLCFLTFIGCNNSISNSSPNNTQLKKDIDKITFNNLKKITEDEIKSPINRHKYDIYFKNNLELANKGVSESQLIVGYMYYNGLGVEQDYDNAAYWLKKNITKNNDAKYYYALILINGTETLDPNFSESYQLIQELSEDNYTKAQTLLGLSLVQGTNKNIPQDIKLGLEWLNTAAKNSDPEALFFIGLFYYDGKIINQDFKKANNYWKKSADLGYAPAMFNYGLNSLDGIGTEKNINDAVYYFEKASKANHVRATYNLGIIYSNSTIQPNIDLKKSLHYFQLAKEQGAGELAQEKINEINKIIN